MTQWSGTAYGSLRLTNPLEVSSAYTAILPDGGVIQTGPRNWPKGTDYSVTLRQRGSWADRVLAGGQVYRIVITFTGSLI